MYKGKPLKSITISLGVSFFPRHTSKPEELIQKADAALYKAKRNGRNRTEVADD
jgi:diguanylate cyclase (GGDEF)-like protein